ncbi:MAG: hypothetical protein LBU65_09300, partial [Planctomycetaceae bacterium]|nr:hypothetical protein [Planctomycetaceae bacterium]
RIKDVKINKIQNDNTDVTCDLQAALACALDCYFTRQTRRNQLIVASLSGGTIDKPMLTSAYVTDYYTTKDDRVFPRRMVLVVPCGFGRVPAKEWNLKDNEPVFVRELVVTYLDTDTPPSEDEFVIELPEPTGIGDGVDYEKGATRIFAGLHPDFGLKITLTDLPRLLNANRAEAAKRDHVPDVTYNKTLDIVVRVLLFAFGMLLLIIGIYGSRRSRRN